MTNDFQNVCHLMFFSYITGPVRNIIKIHSKTVINTIMMFFVQVVMTPDYTNPQTVKNHSEVLRCYDKLGKLFICTRKPLSS